MSQNAWEIAKPAFIEAMGALVEASGQAAAPAMIAVVTRIKSVECQAFWADLYNRYDATTIKTTMRAMNGAGVKCRCGATH